MTKSVSSRATLDINPRYQRNTDAHPTVTDGEPYMIISGVTSPAISSKQISQIYASELVDRKVFKHNRYKSQLSHHSNHGGYDKKQQQSSHRKYETTVNVEKYAG